ncbi:hypothetical protein [Colwellia piezophila]|uniref:hypothetical protein n=1 Tax=Colwellia piezophila TaxID=211668 RepID=UPI0003770FD6|nr:hypothetical protein [Colwellia piezophila]
MVEPPVDCTTDCDVYVNPIEVIVEPIDGTPIDYCDDLGICDVVVEPLPEECMPVAKVVTLVAHDLAVDLINSCTNDFWVVPVSLELGAAFDWSMATAFNAELSSSTQSHMNAFIYGEDAVDGYALKQRMNNVMQSNFYTFKSTLWTDNDDYSVAYVIKNGSAKMVTYQTTSTYTECILSSRTSAYCDVGNQRHWLTVEQFDAIPEPANIKDDFAFIVWSYIKAELYL